MNFKEECQQTVNNIADEIDNINDYEKMLSYFNDVLDIEYRIDAHGKYIGVELLLTCGGPNIVVSTLNGCVKLGWGDCKTIATISHNASTLIDEIFENEFLSLYN